MRDDKYGGMWTCRRPNRLQRIIMRLLGGMIWKDFDRE